MGLLALSVCLLVCLCVSACFPFKLLTHLIDGHEKLYENHAIGVHPKIALLSDNSLWFFIVNVLWCNSRMPNHRNVKKIYN
jgi:hypothetical protein